MFGIARLIRVVLRWRRDKARERLRGEALLERLEKEAEAGAEVRVVSVDK